MRILLIYPNANRKVLSWGDTGALAEPIALEYIGAVATMEGHEVRLLDLRLHNADLEKTLTGFQPDVVGVTAYSMHVLRCLEVCAIAKKLAPSCKTVAGGHHATLEPVDFFEPQIDFVVCGEGTHPFRTILRQIDQGLPVDGVPGVYSRVNGSFHYGGEPLPFSIDEIPCPGRALAPGDRKEYYIDWMKPIAMLRTSVGCPYRCSFCSLWRIMNGRYYTRDLDAVVEELKEIPEKKIFFVDDEPFVNAGRMSALARKIEAAKLDKQFFSYCRTDSLIRHPELMKQWKGIGLERLLLGVETVFDDEAERYNKRQKRAQIIKGIRTAAELGIHLLCNFIVHPSYTEKEFTELIRFIKENEVQYPSFTIWTPLPGTGYPYEEVLIRQPNGRPNWDYFDLQHPVIGTALPHDEFMRRFDNLYQVFTPNYQRYYADNPLAKDPFVALAQRVLRLSGKPAGGD
jgi:radical SAM superfamily enzyme YgiQ (UPF0313 family)